MKLVSLNTCAGFQGKVFFDYLKNLSLFSDIFCFQEVFSSKPPAPQVFNNWRMYLFEELQTILPEFKGYFVFKSKQIADNSESRVIWPVEHGLATFVRNNLKVISHKEILLLDPTGEERNPIEGCVKTQKLVLEYQGRILNIFNMHGMSLPGDKLDTQNRITQSQQLLKATVVLPKSPTIICGDFNLNPETQSITLLENDYRNLIKEFNIKNTRNEISWKLYNHRQHFADYIFVTKEVKVESFEVPYNLVSDHLPMLLEFEI